MKTVILTSLALLLMVSLAWAACTMQVIHLPDRTIICQTCCFNGFCQTTCN